MRKKSKAVKPTKPVIQESERNRIAKGMADHFIKHVTTKELIIWHLNATDLLIDYMAHKNFDKGKYTSAFLAAFRFDLIPALLDAKTTKERSLAFENYLPEIFFSSSYEGTKECIEEIGNAFLSAYAGLSGGEAGFEQFMRILSCFLVTSEMYGNYSFIEKQEKEQRLQAAELIRANQNNPIDELTSFIAEHIN